MIGPLTVGRSAALLLAASFALDLWRTRPRDLHFGRPALLAGGAYLGLFAWILISAGAWGCNCDGKLGGFAEFAFVGILGLGVVSLHPAIRGRVMLAVLAGLAAAAALALLGVGALNSGTVDLTQTGGRLSGTYGNANELGFALALGLPICVAYLIAAREKARFYFIAVFALLALALVLTFSRGGIAAAGVGVVAVALWSTRGSRRRLALILAGAGAAALLAAALYSVFQSERQEASFAAVPTSLRPLGQRDLSGWDARPVGPIPSGPASLRNRPGGFLVRGGGASYGWGEAARGGDYLLRFRARAAGRKRVSISLALGDAIRGGGPEARAVLGPHPRTYELAWQPQLRSPHATLYVWQHRSRSAAFVLGAVSVRAQAPGRGARVIDVPDQLRGSIYTHLLARAANEEDRYVSSRLDAARLALDAFVANPLRGIGWGTFPAYSAEHLDYGELAAHDQYLSFAAELGIVGLLLLGLLVAGAVAGIRRAGDSVSEIAAIGAFVAAAAGLVFVEALPVPQLSIPIAVAIAALCAGRTPERSA